MKRLQEKKKKPGGRGKKRNTTKRDKIGNENIWQGISSATKSQNLELAPSIF